MNKLKQNYKILGVNMFCSDNKLKQAYRNKASKYHVLMSKGDKEATQKFNEVLKAYELIQSSRKKQNEKFNRFKKFFKKRKNTKYTDSDFDGRNIYSTIEISFDESVHGCKKVIYINKNKPCICGGKGCEICNGEGEISKRIALDVRLPKGVFDMQTIKITGKGQEGINGGKNGDLMLNVHVKPSDKFERRGLDIYSNVLITFPEAVLGGNKVVDTIYGKVEYSIPPGLPSGSKVCLKKRGIEDESAGVIGNHYITMQVDVPKVTSIVKIEQIKEFDEKFYKKNE